MSLGEQFRQIFGERIKTRRRELRLTQEELSKRLRISRVHLANIEAGSRRASVLFLAQIAETLEAPLEQLVPKMAEAEERLAQSRKVSLRTEKKPKLLSGELEALNISVDSGSTLEKALKEVQRQGDEFQDKTRGE